MFRLVVKLFFFYEWYVIIVYVLMYNEIFGESIVKEKFMFRFDVKLMFLMF